jgi:hypothetical protein
MSFFALQIYQVAATMPIWQLRSGACVHIQEGAFLPPKVGPLPPPAATAPAGVPDGAGAPQSGLGEEAREFIMQHLPLFQVKHACPLSYDVMLKPALSLLFIPEMCQYVVVGRQAQQLSQSTRHVVH